MNAIGFRVTPKQVFYSILEERDEHYELVSISKIIVPVSVDLPNQLSYIRNVISTILEQYQINFAGIKLIEGNARGSNNNALIFRFNIEGVIQELFANSTVENYILGITSNISSILNIAKGKPQDMLNQFIEDIDELKTDDQKRITSEHKDAIIVALAAIEMGIKNV